MRGLLAGRRETMNYKIEKNTVQETLIIPLYARKMCSELYPNLYRDEAALRLVGAVDYDLSLIHISEPTRLRLFGTGKEIKEPYAALRLSGGCHAAERLSH